MSAPRPVWELHTGDNIEVLRSMPDESFDAIVTDPPYGLGKAPDALAMLRDWLDSGHHAVTGTGFMGRKWDAFVPQPALWKECFRVLKPGGHVLAFAGTRTQDLMALGLRIAGFEIRDLVAWIYGSGFPKSLNVAKAIESGGGRPEDIRRMQMGEDYTPSGRGRVNYDHGAASAMDGNPASWTATSEAARPWQGWGTALKPALEPITVARKPLDGTVAANVLEHGTGALNIDGCRVPVDPAADASQLRTMTRSVRAPGDGWGMSTVEGDTPQVVRADGRWPANLIHDGSEEVVALFPADAGALAPVRGDEPAANGFSGAVKYSGMRQRVPGAFHADAGSAARFFYCPKASKSDRGAGNNHPTVKPTDLMRYLCRLVTPPGGLILDPHVGSGSTGKAAVLEGFNFIGIDNDPESIRIARQRITHADREAAAAAPEVGARQAQIDLTPPCAESSVVYNGFLKQPYSEQETSPDDCPAQ